MQSERFVHLGLHRLRRGHGDQSKTVMVLFLYFKNRKESEDMKKMEQLANLKAFLCMVFCCGQAFL